LVLGAGFVLAPLVVAGPARQAASSVPASDSLDDGPHVYWLDARHAIAFYLCRDSVTVLRLEATGDTVAFAGRCADSLATYRLPTHTRAPARDTWRDVPRFLAVSDVHGEYDAFVAFLTRAGVLDAEGRWTWGDGHLVVVGDVFDRGARVTECLWLLYRLEQEAERAGGRVHLVLGNHEVMAMRDDLRYVHPRYATGIVRRARVRYPDLFGPDTELGRWLRTKPFALKLNDVVLVHGGLPPQLVERGLDLSELNRLGRASLDLSSLAVAFSDEPAWVLGSGGPLWYRGYVREPEGRSAAADLDTVLRFYGATAMVVGHTEVGTLRRLHDGRLYAIDVSLQNLGTFQGLLWENGTFNLVTGTGTITPLN
jgi:hypothetical protein